jgi:hypothetical protein
MTITSIKINQIVISDPIINKIKNFDYNIDLKKFRKIPNGFGNNINHEIKIINCYSSIGFLQTSGFPLNKDIPVDYDTRLSHIDVAQCYNYNNQPLIKSGHQLYYIINGRHRMASAILNNQKDIDVRVIL